MSTEPNSAVAGRAEALVVYRLADSLVQFRHYAELNYARAPEPYEFGGDPPPPPRVVDTCFQELLADATRLASDLTIQEATALVDAARAVHRLFHESWHDAAHRARLAERREVVETSDRVNDSELDWLVLRGSPLGPSAWDDLNTTAARLTERLPSCFCPVFELGRTLAEVNFPYPSSYNAGMGVVPVSDSEHLITDIGPRIACLIREVRSRLHLLQTVDGWLRGAKPHAAARNLRKCVRAAFGKAVACDEPAAPNPHQPAALATAVAPAPICATAVPSPSEVAPPPLRAGEDVAALTKMKDRIDKQCAGHVYIGRSLPLLRMFRQIEDLNRMPDEPVVILGPSGSGKTELAHVIHLLSARSQRSFKHLQANDVSGGDEGIVRDRWVGRGQRSGLGKADDGGPVTGWLQECAGGTIFLDELHNLDSFNQQYLRKVFDRKPIPVAAGRGPDVNPDVRLIFATFWDRRRLAESRVLNEDFYRRLGNRYITVPSLNDRKEDIPLFVEKFRDGRKFKLDFLLALILSDWSEGQVAQLIQAIKTAVSRTNPGDTIAVTHLAGEVSTEVADRVARMPDQEVKRALLSFLKSALTAQGFEAGGHGNGLQRRLAGLLSMPEPTLSRWLKDAGLSNRSEAGGQ